MVRVSLALLCFLSGPSDVYSQTGPDSSEVLVQANQLALGQRLPSFIATDDRGQRWKLQEHLGKKTVVLYFYPGDFTGGCIKQAKAFRDSVTKLEELNIKVVGISGDSVETHQLFKKSHGLGHTLLADADAELARQLGIPVQPGARVRTRDLQGSPLLNEKNRSIFVEREITLPRWTLILDRDGRLVSLRTDVNPATDAEEVRKIVEDLAKN